MSHKNDLEESPSELSLPTLISTNSSRPSSQPSSNTMLVKNFLFLSALAVVVVSAADKQTSLRHKQAGRGLKKKKKNENGGGGTELDVATNRFNTCKTQRPTFDFTNVANGGVYNPKTSGYILGVGSTGANGQFVASGCDTMTVDMATDDGAEESIEVNRVTMNAACAEDEICCNFHSECSSGCCTGWFGCVEEGTAAYISEGCGGR